MTHSHFGSGSTGPVGAPPMVDPDELRRHRRALRILIVVLIPLAIWTVVGLIVFWPGDVSDRVNPDLAGGYNIPGVTYPSARITEVKEISCDGLPGSTPDVSELNCAEVVVELLEGDDKGLAVSVPLTEAVYSSGVEVGQVIKLTRVPAIEDQPAQYQFADFERRTPLIVLTVIFAIAVVAVARWRGFASLIGLVFAGFILVKFMFPALVAGSNPVLVGLIGSSAIMFVVLYAAHGFSARTSTALVGTLFGLIMIALLGLGASRWAHLTGVASEEDFVLSAAAPDLTLTSVVLCGIIVAGLGVLNDVTITQASAVWELADEGLGQRHLFAKAMRIGRDHIASTVYTIAFATAGAALSVLLLISIYDRPLLQVVQTEQFAGEIIRTLVGVDRAGAGRAADHRGRGRRGPRQPQCGRSPAASAAAGVEAAPAARVGAGPAGGRGRTGTASDVLDAETTGFPVVDEDTGERPVVSARRRRDRGAARHQVADLRAGADGATATLRSPPGAGAYGLDGSGRRGPGRAGRKPPVAAIPAARGRGRLRRLHLPPRAGRHRPGPTDRPGPAYGPRLVARTPRPLTAVGPSAGEVDDRLQPGVGLVAVQAVATVQLDEGVGDLPGGRPVRSPQHGGVAGPVPTPTVASTSRRRDHQGRDGQRGGLQPGPVRTLAQAGGDVLRPAAGQVVYRLPAVPVGPVRLTLPGLPVDAAGSRRADATPVSTASASASQSTLLGPGSSSRTTERISGPSASRLRATAAPKECPTTRSIGRSASSRTTQPAATSGVSGRPARGLAPWAGRSGALTRQPASASAGPTRHQVAEEEVEPCSSNARRPAPPQERQRRNPRSGTMAAVCP